MSKEFKYRVKLSNGDIKDIVVKKIEGWWFSSTKYIIYEELSDFFFSTRKEIGEIEDIGQLRDALSGYYGGIKEIKIRGS